MQRIGEHQHERRATERGPWKNQSVALCADDSCPWKHVDTFERTQQKAEQHASDSGHDVYFARTQSRTISLAREAQHAA